MIRELRIVLGTDIAPSEAGSVPIDLGVDHPSRAGVVRFDVGVEDDRIVRATAAVGAMHRGVEKLFEVRDYRQILSLADRHDWQAPFFGEAAAAIAVERSLGIEVPERAVWWRTLLAEHFRLHSHLGFLSWVWHARAATQPLVGLRAVREGLRRQTQALTGNRIHPMVTRIGGMAADAGAGWFADERRVVAEAAGLADGLESAIAALPAGVAPLGESVVDAYGVSGPAARAAGLSLDARPGTFAYDEVDEPLDVGVTSGDAAGRLLVQARELRVSARIVAVCADRLEATSGPVAVDLPKILRVPEGELEVLLEAPLGLAGCFLVSRGEKTPWRFRLRTPSFANVAALEAVLPGTTVEDVPLALASLGYVMGDLDK